MNIPTKPVDGVQTPSSQPSVDYYQVQGKNETLESNFQADRLSSQRHSGAQQAHQE